MGTIIFYGLVAFLGYAVLKDKFPNLNLADLVKLPTATKTPPAPIDPLVLKAQKWADMFAKVDTPEEKTKMHELWPLLDTTGKETKVT